MVWKKSYPCEARRTSNTLLRTQGGSWDCDIRMFPLFWMECAGMFGMCWEEMGTVLSSTLLNRVPSGGSGLRLRWPGQQCQSGLPSMATAHGNVSRSLPLTLSLSSHLSLLGSGRAKRAETVQRIYRNCPSPGGLPALSLQTEVVLAGCGGAAVYFQSLDDIQRRGLWVTSVTQETFVPSSMSWSDSINLKLWSSWLIQIMVGQRWGQGEQKHPPHKNIHPQCWLSLV